MRFHIENKTKKNPTPNTHKTPAKTTATKKSCQLAQCWKKPYKTNKV